jgi:hypothetical protein
MCDLCPDDDDVFASPTIPSGRWSWWRFAADVSRLGGRLIADVAEFVGRDMAMHFSFVQNLHVDMDDARDFAEDVLSSINSLED